MKRFAVWLGLSTVLMGAVLQPNTAPAPEHHLAQKENKGFQTEQPGCDFRFLQGWFFWYIDSSYTCYTVPVNSQAEAVRRAEEILEYSFSVIIVGHGFGQ